MVWTLELTPSVFSEDKQRRRLVRQGHGNRVDLIRVAKEGA